MDPLAQIIVEDQRWRDKHHPHRIRKGQSTGWTLYLRRTFPMLEQTLVDAQRIFPNIDPGADYHAQSHTWTFSSGYRYQFGHCKDPTDYLQYYSRQFSWLGFDELVQFEQEQYQQIGTRIRSVDPILGKMLKKRAMSNPMVLRENMDNISLKDPMWVRKYFIDDAPNGKTTLETRRVSPRSGKVHVSTRIFLPATLYDHPDPEFIDRYEKDLLGMPKHIREALLYGNWDYTAGAFFLGWDKRIHTCKAFRIPDDWPRFRSMDWGFKSPGCVHWWAMDHDGNLVCEREMTFKEKSAMMVAHDIKKVEEELGIYKYGESLITGPADTQLWERRDSVLSKADEMLRVGIRWTPASKVYTTATNVGGRRRNAELLQGRISDYSKVGGHPGIQFFEKCIMAVMTIPRVMAEVGDPSLPMDSNDDHWLDSVLYACAYASHGRKRMKEPDRDRNPYLEEPEATVSHGQYGYGDVWQ